MLTKFRNVPTNGYASKHEARRAAELEMLARCGEVRNLRTQVSYLLIPAQTLKGRLVERACRYIADFVYQLKVSEREWLDVVEDAKGVKTPTYRIKRKLMLQVHGIKVREV